jgi:HAD superfamily phosphoserine phosphatase-like hydrolase
MKIFGRQPLTAVESDFLQSVLRLEPRVAAFDCDGTLWSGDAGMTFFQWEIENGVVPVEVGQAMRARYAEYQAGKVSEDDISGEMVTMHKGLSDAAMMQAASEFMARFFPGFIFPEMRELVRRLHENGCEVWVVSSSNEWVIRVGVREFGIAENRILAVQAELENGIVTDRLVRIPSGPGKPQALREAVGRDVDAAFGNSRWDMEMLASARHPFVINPDPDLAAAAQQHGWPIYFLDGTRAVVRGQ